MRPPDGLLRKIQWREHTGTMRNRIHRSMLILPVNNPKFVAKAYLRQADAIVLDLEDAVPPQEKVEARRLLKDAIKAVGLGGADVFVRVNNEPELIEGDVEAALCKGLHGIFVPKIDSGDQVRCIVQMISAKEHRKDAAVGGIVLSLHVESPRGVLRLEEVSCASTRTESLSLGVDDYCREMGIESPEDGEALLYALARMAVVSAAYGINALGVIGSVAGFKDLAGFERAAIRSKKLGFKGAYCIHPDQVPILNRVFSPAPAKVTQARKIVAAFKEGIASGRAALSIDNRMIDTPIYKQALQCLELAKEIEDLETRKQKALRLIGK